MNSNKISNIILDIKRVLENVYPIKIKTEFRISKRGVPYVRVQDIYNICYFAKSNFFRIFKHGNKFCDIKKRNDVISFFKQEEYIN